MVEGAQTYQRLMAIREAGYGRGPNGNINFSEEDARREVTFIPFEATVESIKVEINAALALDPVKARIIATGYLVSSEEYLRESADVGEIFDANRQVRDFTEAIVFSKAPRTPSIPTPLK